MIGCLSGPIVACRSSYSFGYKVIGFVTKYYSGFVDKYYNGWKHLSLTMTLVIVVVLVTVISILFSTYFLCFIDTSTKALFQLSSTILRLCVIRRHWNRSHCGGIQRDEAYTAAAIAKMIVYLACSFSILKAALTGIKTTRLLQEPNNSSEGPHAWKTMLDYELTQTGLRSDGW